MPRTKGPPTAAEYALLGLLQEGPAHGYRLAQRFAPGRDLGLLYPLEQGMVYALLHELEARGLITGCVEAVGPRPPRTLFAITEAGAAQLRRWLAEPVEPLHRLRLDFLLKLSFAFRLDPPGASRLIGEQLAAGERYLADLDTELSGLDPDTLAYLVLESKRVAVAGFQTWLRERGDRLQPLQAPAAAAPERATAGEQRSPAGA
jgi:PadR family transcriptional regulator AphA